MKLVLLKPLALLLHCGVSQAYPAQQLGPNTLSHSAWVEKIKFFPSLSIHESSPDRLFRRQDEDARSEVFINDAVKGAKAWETYQSTLWQGQSGPSTKVPLVHDTQRAHGWKTDEKGNEIPEAANIVGWRFWRTQFTPTAELGRAIKLAIPRLSNLSPIEITANEWKDPRFEIIASFDCNNGLIISSASFFEYSATRDGVVITRRSQYRWSDVMWGLWTAVCPNQKANLKYIVRDTIVNGVSRAVMREAAIEADHYSTGELEENDGKVTIWEPTELKLPISEDSCDAADGDCDFYAVLHTPNAIGVLWLVWGHSNELMYDGITSTIARITGVTLYKKENQGEEEDGDDGDDEEDEDDVEESSKEEKHIKWFSVIELGKSSC